MIEAEALIPGLIDFLPRQRWYAGTEAPASLEIRRLEVSGDDWPVLADLVVDADGESWQVVVGIRALGERPEFLRGHDGAVVGEIHTANGPALAYEATLDHDLGLMLLGRVTSGSESAARVHPVGVEQSNTSLVYDERLILKLFRHLVPGPNPDVEVTEALAEVGFEHVAAPIATEVFEGTHLAVVQPYLLGGTEGWAMALTSLRDLFGVHDTQPMPVIDPNAPPPAEPDPGDAGGDFSGEAERLGVVTAEMHLALAQAFGEHPADPSAWADKIAAEAARLAPGDLDPAAAAEVLDTLRSVSDPGVTVRVHGDYHLGQVLRTDTGWFILDFEGEPSRSLEERRRPASPLRDVAGMLRSFHYASCSVLAASHASGAHADPEKEKLAAAWEERNRQAFLDGYLARAAKGDILPDDEASVAALLRAFELEKAVYELAYEQSHRPDWAGIPRAALRRITEERSHANEREAS